MHCDTVEELLPVGCNHRISTLVGLKVRDAVIQNVASFKNMEWVQVKRGDEGREEVFHKTVPLDNGLFSVHVFLQPRPLLFVRIDVKHAPSITFVEAKDTLAVQALHALAVGLVDGRPVRLIESDLTRCLM